MSTQDTPTEELRQLVFEKLGETSVIFMSDATPGTQQVMPTAKLEVIGNNLVAKLETLLDRVRVEAQVSILKEIEPPEQYEEYAKLMGSEQCRICGFNAVQFRKHIADRIATLTGEEQPHG